MPFIQSFEVRKGSLPHLLRRSPLAEGAKSKCAIKRQVQLICTCLLLLCILVSCVGIVFAVSFTTAGIIAVGVCTFRNRSDFRHGRRAGVGVGSWVGSGVGAGVAVGSGVGVGAAVGSGVGVGVTSTYVLSLSASLSDSASEVSVLVTTGVVYVTTSFSPVCLATFVTVGRSSSVMQL